MTRTIDDVVSYQKQALDLLDKDHPHYDEIRLLLTDQIMDAGKHFVICTANELNYMKPEEDWADDEEY